MKVKEYYTRVFVREDKVCAFLMKSRLSWRFVGTEAKFYEAGSYFGAVDLYEFEYIDYTPAAHAATIRNAEHSPISSVGTFVREISENNPLI